MLPRHPSGAGGHPGVKGSLRSNGQPMPRRASSPRRSQRSQRNGSEPEARDYSNITVDGLYVIDGRIGGGSFSDCYVGKELGSNSPVCFKIEDVAKIRGPARLSAEYDMIDFVSTSENNASRRHVPRPLYFAALPQFNGVSVMVQELLGPSLGDLLKMCGGRFSVNTTAWLALQTIDCLQSVHEKGYVHRDVKPQNFLIGRLDDAHQVFICDFGLAKRRSYRSSPRTGGKPAGTIRYVSLNAHNGVEQTMRDDLEAVGYMLVHFIRGKLPWQNTPGHPDKKKRHDHIHQWKEKHSISELCEGCPQPLENYMHMCRGMRFDQTPNYPALRAIFAKMMADTGGDKLKDLDWRKQKQYTTGTGTPSPVTGHPKKRVIRSSSTSQTPSAQGSGLGNSMTNMNNSPRRHSHINPPGSTSPRKGEYTRHPQKAVQNATAYADKRKGPNGANNYFYSESNSDEWTGSFESDGSPFSERARGRSNSPRRLSTGSRSQKTHQVGTNISALFGGKFHPGSIYSLNTDGTYVVKWVDGTYTTGVVHGDVRLREENGGSFRRSSSKGSMRMRSASPNGHGSANHSIRRAPSAGAGVTNGTGFGEFSSLVPGCRVEAIYRGQPFAASVYARDAQTNTYTICWEDGSHSLGMKGEMG